MKIVKYTNYYYHYFVVPTHKDLSVDISINFQTNINSSTLINPVKFNDEKIFV